MAIIETTRSNSASVASFRQAVSKTLGAFSAWNDARATRKALTQLSDRELDDIGLSRGDIEGVLRRC